MLALGVFPKVSLDDARKKRAEILAKIDKYIAPRIVKEKSVTLPDGTIEGSFKDVAHRWYLKGKESWKPSHSRTVLARLEQMGSSRDLATLVCGMVSIPHLIR